MNKPPEAAIDFAIECADQSPCQKSKRGAVLFMGDVPVGGAFNGPPTGYECRDNGSCRRVCAERCMHAEERVFIKAGRLIDLAVCEMVHVKIRDGLLMPSGNPSCWQCSRTIVDVGLAGMWLYHEEGWKRYTAKEFNDLTLFECGIAIG